MHVGRATHLEEVPPPVRMWDCLADHSISADDESASVLGLGFRCCFIGANRTTDMM